MKMITTGSCIPFHYLMWARAKVQRTCFAAEFSTIKRVSEQLEKSNSCPWEESSRKETKLSKPVWSGTPFLYHSQVAVGSPWVSQRCICPEEPGCGPHSQDGHHWSSWPEAKWKERKYDPGSFPGRSPARVAQRLLCRGGRKAEHHSV